MNYFLLLFVFFSNQWVFADSVILRDKNSGFENKTCADLFGQFNKQEIEFTKVFLSKGNSLDCSRNKVLERALAKLAKITDSTGLVEKSKILLEQQNIKLKLKELAIKCWDELEAFQKEQQSRQLLFVQAMNVRVSLMDVANIYGKLGANEYFSSSCKGYSSAFSRSRKSQNETDSEFIRNHSMTCHLQNQIEVRPSLFQTDLKKNYPGYTINKNADQATKYNFTFTDKLQKLYSNDEAFKDRQICQAYINKFNEDEEANRIKPPVRRPDAVEKPKKLDECEQFENTFDCKRLEGVKEVKIMTAWPSCATAIIQDCVDKLSDKGLINLSTTPAHGDESGKVDVKR